MIAADHPGFPGDVSRETLDRLQAFNEALGRWTRKINLISPDTVADRWHRHVADSAQLWPHLTPRLRLWADLGSGGGLPVVVVAILATQYAPKARFVAVEADQRKAAFLRSCKASLGLALDIHAARIETLPPIGADIVSARALAPLTRLFGLIAPHLAEGGKAVLMKGAEVGSELAAAEADWRFDFTMSESKTEPKASILTVERITRA